MPAKTVLMRKQPYIRPAAQKDDDYWSDIISSSPQKINVITHTHATYPSKFHSIINPSVPQPPPTSMAGSATSSSFLLYSLTLLLLIAAPVFVAVVLYQPPDFNPVPLPADHSFGPSISIPDRHERALEITKRVGDGLLLGPEDLAYHRESGFLYTGCKDGWIRRVKIDGGEEEKVEAWAYVGGRPLGIAFAPDGSLVVAEVDKGLLIVKPDKTINLLVDEAEGLKFLITDGVDVASDSVIYFTDASYKYTLERHMLDILEGRPYGRLLSFDPSTNQTTVLLRDLYFANGVALSPDQQSLVYCETPLRRCNRYHIHGDKKGTVEKFIENLPGFPDNIRYDGEGRYWIALASGRNLSWDLLYKHPFLRKILICLAKFFTIRRFQENSGVMSVNLEGEAISLYSDQRLFTVTGGLKIGKHLYFGSLVKEYIGRIALEEDGSDLIKSSK